MILAGGAGEGVGPHGRPLRYYVVARARTDAEHRDAPHALLHEIPLPRQSVERVLEAVGLDPIEYIQGQLPDVEGEETPEQRVARAREAWASSWADVAKLLPEYHGMDDANVLAQVAGKFRWDMRLQRLQEAQLSHDAEALSKPRLLTRAMAMWMALSRLAQVEMGGGDGASSSLLHALFPHASEGLLAAAGAPEEDRRAAFVALSDEAFTLGECAILLGSVNDDGRVLLLPRVAEADAAADAAAVAAAAAAAAAAADADYDAASAIEPALEHHAYADADVADAALVSWHEAAKAMPTNEAEHSDVNLVEAELDQRADWRQALLSAASETPDVQAFRYKYGGGAPPSVDRIQASVRPTETEAFHPQAVASRFSHAPEGDVEFARHTLVKENGAEALHASVPAAWADLRAGYAAHLDVAFADVLQYEPRSWLARAIVGVLAGHGLRVARLRTYVQSIAGNEDAKVALKEALRACWRGYGVPSSTLDAATDHMEPTFYSTATEATDGGGDGGGAFAAAYILLDADGHVRAAVWSQRWAGARESRLLRVEANSVYADDGIEDIRAAPYTEFTGAQYVEVDAGMHESLYIRAAGARSAADNRWAYMLQVLMLAEKASDNFKGLIARVPRAAPIPAAVQAAGGADISAAVARTAFAPHYGVLADQAQLLGLQRAVSLPIADLLATDDATRAAATDLLAANGVPAVTYADALGSFALRKEGGALNRTQAYSGPWFVSVKPAISAAAAETNVLAGISSGAVRLPAHMRTIAGQTTMRKTPHLLFPFLTAYFAASVYPTPQHMVGMFAMIRLLLVASPDANNTIAGEAPAALAGGAYTSMPVWASMPPPAVTDDAIDTNEDAASGVTAGQLTTLERVARTLPEEALWYGSAADLMRNAELPSPQVESAQ